jgi:hypothetical protein
MSDGIGRALWTIYEDAVKARNEGAESGVSGATVKFIKAFERELADARIDLYNHSAVAKESKKIAEIRRLWSTRH